jgi:hypothetical protein
VTKPKRTPKQRSRAAPKRAAKRAAPKPKPKQKAAKAASKPKQGRRPAPKKAKRPAATSAAKWTKFVEKHGVVLASARGPVPSVAEAIAGEPIVGSWWSHPKAQVIFDALSSIDDSNDVRCFKLVDKKITLVHRRVWPALVKLAQAGVIPADRVESIQQEHMPTGEHRNFTIPFPDWVPEEVSAAAESLSLDDAREQLGSWM